jgi:hypothetical protein
LGTTLYLVATSRKLRQPLAACVKAPSASGKSYIATIIISLMPPEDVIEATSITPAALYYMPPGSLTHKVVSAAERKHASRANDADIANANLALREMISAGRLGGLQSQSQPAPWGFSKKTSLGV